MSKSSDAAWAGGGVLALLALAVKTSPKLIIATAVSLNLGDFLKGVVPSLHNEVEKAKQEKIEKKPSATPFELPIRKRRDPALLMAERVFVFNDNSPLYAASDDYKKIAGTLARFQVNSLRNQQRRDDLPIVMINGVNECKRNPSVGVYHTQCKSIAIDFSANGLMYEQDEEIIAVMAHEWAHHLANISGINFSMNEGEIVSDCYAGLLMGWLHKNSLATQKEVENAGLMMIQIGNNSAAGIHPNSETRLSAFIGGAASVTSPGGEQANLYKQYCGSLDQIVDKNAAISTPMSWQ